MCGGRNKSGIAALYGRMAGKSRSSGADPPKDSQLEAAGKVLKLRLWKDTADQFSIIFKLPEVGFFGDLYFNRHKGQYECTQIVHVSY